MSEQSDGVRPPPTGSENMDTHGKNPNKGRHHRNRNRRGNHEEMSKSKYEGKCDDLKGFTYDVTHGNQTSDMFMRTTKEIAEYIGRTYNDAGEFRIGMPVLSMPDLVEPPRPSEESLGRPMDAFDAELWKMDMQTYRKKKDNRERNKHHAYALVLGQ